MRLSPRSLSLQCLLLLLVPLAPAALVGLLHPKAPRLFQQEALAPGEVRLDIARDWEPEVLWVDARSRPDFEEAHIPGAVLLNEEEWETLFFDFAGTWDGSRKIVVYCGASQCQASHRVAERLREALESEEIHVLHGGWKVWLDR